MEEEVKKQNTQEDPLGPISPEDVFGTSSEPSVQSKKSSHMSLMMILFIGYRNLKVGRVRSLLTIGGVAIGISIVTFIICLGFGIQKVVVSEVTKNNASDIVDLSNANLESFVVLNDETVRNIKEIDGVKEVEVLMNSGGKVGFENSQTDVVSFAANKEYFKLANIDVNAGSLDEYVNGENTAIVSSRLAGLLGFSSGNEIIGKEIEFTLVMSKDISDKEIKAEGERQTLKVVGSINDNQNTLIYIPFLTAKNNFNVTSAQSAKVKIEEEKIDSVRSRIEQMGFVSESIIDLLNEIDSFFTLIRGIMVVLGTIIMSISAMGMLNTLSVSLLQRTREVGILKALGAKRKDTFRMFIFEAALISFVGGILGFLTGYIGALVVNLVFNMLAAKQRLSSINFVYIPYSFLVAISLFIFFLGFSTGILPARRAARIHALDALRYE